MSIVIGHGNRQMKIVYGEPFVSGVTHSAGKAEGVYDGGWNGICFCRFA